MTDPLALYVVYENPKDYPGKFVIRQWKVRSVDPNAAPDDTPFIVSDNYERAIGELPAHLVKLSRDPNDDPCIKEIWL